MPNFRGGRDALLFDWYQSLFGLTARQAQDGYTKRIEAGKCPPIPQGERVEANTSRRTTPNEQHWRWRAGCDKRTHHATFQTANQVAMI